MAEEKTAEIGVLVVSHVKELAQGVQTLIKQVAADVPVVACGGTTNGGVGTDFAALNAAVTAMPVKEVWAFFDLGSAKMNLQMVKEMNSKPLTLWETPLVEGAYTAASLLQAKADKTSIESQLKELAITK